MKGDALKALSAIVIEGRKPTDEEALAALIDATDVLVGMGLAFDRIAVAMEALATPTIVAEVCHADRDRI